MAPITLVAVNAKYSHTNLALLYLKASFEACTLVEWDINSPMRELLEKLIESGSTHFIFSAYIWNAGYLKRLIPDLSTLHPSAVICVGGPEAVYNQADWQSINGLDYILDGNAENFAAVIPDFIKPDQPKILNITPRPFCETRFPYTPNMIENFKGRIIYYEASRGCKFKCSYCLSAVGTTLPEYRSQEQIIREIAILGRFEGTVKFVDRTFNGNTEVSRLIWRLIAKNPPVGCFHFELHPVLLEDEDFKLIAALKPGTAQFEIGIQSTDPTVLKNVNRPDNWQLSKENIRKLIDMKHIHIHLDQIIGLPGDTPKTASRSMDEILSLKPDMFQLGFLKLLPGTPLEAMKSTFGIKAPVTPPYEVLETNSFTFSELQYFHRIEKLVSRLYNSGFFVGTLSFLAKKTGSWLRMFETLLINTPDLNCRRWDYWGEKILAVSLTSFPELISIVTDLLRLDWCPFAGAQYYPEFIRYADDKEMNRLKTEACRKVQTEHPELKKSELKRAILFLPECDRPNTYIENSSILFVKNDGIVRKYFY